MEKIPTLFVKNPKNKWKVDPVVDPDCKWVLAGNAYVTRKWDGTACAIMGGKFFKRRQLTTAEAAYIDGAISCDPLLSDPSSWSEKRPHWVPVTMEKEDRWLREALLNTFDAEITRGISTQYNGTYECCGPKINGNPEQFSEHILVPHGEEKYGMVAPNYTPEDYFEVMEESLSTRDIEGVVFYEIGGNRRCKLRQKDFGLKRKRAE